MMTRCGCLLQHRQAKTYFYCAVVAVWCIRFAQHVCRRDVHRLEGVVEAARTRLGLEFFSLATWKQAQIHC